MAEIIHKELFENGEVVGYEYGGRLVRCKDCKWWKTNYSWNGNEHKICVREPYEPLRNAEDFCSHGEREKDERK